MISRRYRGFLFVIPFVFAHLCATAQDEIKRDPVAVRIELKDNSFLKGKLVGVEKDSAVFINESEETVKIPLKKIRNIHYINEHSAEIKEWFSPPNRIRYLFSSTAFPLRKGEIILASAYGFLHSAQFGVSDRITLGAGGDLFGGTIGYLNARVNLLDNDSHKFSAGGSFYFLPSEIFSNYTDNKMIGISMLSVASTWGTESNHFTLGAGYIYYAKGFIPPIVTVAGTTRIAKRFALVTENWFLFVGEKTGMPVLISIGARYFNKRHTIDLALFSDSESVFGSFLPYVAYSVKIGNR